MSPRFRRMGKTADRGVRGDVPEASLQLRHRPAHHRRRDPDHPPPEQEAPRGVRHRLPLPPRQPPRREAQGQRPPPTYRAHTERTPDPIHTPVSTPVRSRSPAIPSTSTPSRSRTPVPAVPPIPSTAPMPALAVPTPVSASPNRSPSSSRLRSPIPPPRTASQASFRSQTPTNDAGVGAMPSRSVRGSPAPPPPRSRDRPGSAAGQRPQGLEPPSRRQGGMF